jgi:plastocyanin
MDKTETREVTVVVGDSGDVYPEWITVNPGTTVIWQWESTDKYTIEAEDGSFDSGEPQRTGTFEYTFSESGEYPYYAGPYEVQSTRGYVSVVGDPLLPIPDPPIPQQGTFNITLEGGEPWPDDYFDGDADLHIPHTIQELRETYHFNQLDRIVDTPVRNGFSQIPEEYHQLVKQFPRKLTDPEWLQTEVYDLFQEKYGGDISGTFDPEKFLNGENLDERHEESGYHDLWTRMEEILYGLGNNSSAYDYQRTAAASGVDYHSAGEETFTTDFKTTPDRIHGLGIALTNLTYNQSETGQQEAWLIETDPSHSKIWGDLSNYLGEENIFTEPGVDDREAATLAWESLGFEPKIRTYDEWENRYNVNLEFSGVDQFSNFLLEPGQETGQNYVDGPILAAHIEENATSAVTEDNTEFVGEYPYMDDATIRIHPTKITYELSPSGN